MPPFEPFACDHAAFLIGRRPWEVSRDPQLLFEAQRQAIQEYDLRLCLAGIDIYNAEAEALGCAVAEPEGNNSPAIFRPLYSELSAIQNLAFDPEKDGRLPMIMQTAARLKENFPACDVRVPVCGPFSLAGHLLGMENLLCAAADNPAGVKEKLLQLAGILRRYVRAIYKRRLNVAVFESSASPPLLAPLLFEKLAAPALRLIFDDAFSARRAAPALIIGGNTLPIIAPLLALQPAYIICPVETDQQKFMAKISPRGNLRVRINMSPAGFLASTPADALQEARRALALARRVKNTSVGLLLPFAAAPAIVKAVAAFIRNPNQDLARAARR